MRLLNCPKPEGLFEYVSIPGEISSWKRMGMRLHTSRCGHCQKQMQAIQSTWQNYFPPEPEVTSSLIKVYSRLQNDETLILKGWKLSETPPRHESLGKRLLSGGWIFRGAVSLSVASLFVMVMIGQGHLRNTETTVASSSARLPLAQIRFEDKNRVKVQYVQPELLQSIEFETTNGLSGR